MSSMPMRGPVALEVDRTQVGVGFGVPVGSSCAWRALIRFLLIGNHNVGKSILFSRLIGVRNTASHYPVTTFSFLLYREVACALLPTGDFWVNVVDATHPKRSLYLTLELLERCTPMVVALNVWDDARHQGIHVNPKALEQMLGVPLVPTVAVTGEGGSGPGPAPGRGKAWQRSPAEQGGTVAGGGTHCGAGSADRAQASHLA